MGKQQRQSVDDVLDAIRPHTETVPVVLDETTGTVVEFVFRALGSTQLRDLKLAHPPTEKQRKRFRKDQLDRGVPPTRLLVLDFDEDTYPPALLAESCVSHDWGPEQWAEFLASEKVSEAIVQQITQGCGRAQVTPARVDPEA